MLHLKRGFTYFLCFNIIITSFPGWVFAALIQSHFITPKPLTTF
ncbi:hypothetical protein [uncultured Gammaproteobacteria bacterium]|nr:hypothetical protein [uncultured Gammaproteobacteria bacterium]